MPNPSLLFYRVRSIADRSKHYSERHFKLLGALAILVMPATTVIEKAVGDPSFNTLYVRAIVGLAGLPFVFHDRLPRIVKRHLGLLWVFSVTLVFPLCYGILLTFNAVLAPENHTPSPVWVYQYLVALFVFIQLINHGPLSVTLWLLATISVFLGMLILVPQPNYDALRDLWLYPLPVYLTALFIGSLTNRNVHIVQLEQLRAASAIGGNIAHELRTPLASIRSLARGIGRFLPDLVKSHEMAKSAGLDVRPISSAQLDELRVGLKTIQDEVAYSNTTIDMLLANTLERPSSPQEFEELRISEVVNEAVSRFPFNNSNERRMLRCTLDQDFRVFGPRILLVHVLFNLIKNGLYFVQRGTPGLIHLRTTRWPTANVLEVTDLGIGIPSSIRTRIFDRFFSASDAGQGAGIGLSFCKMVMESVNGQIQCDSKEGQYTTFRLVFPTIEHARHHSRKRRKRQHLV